MTRNSGFPCAGTVASHGSEYPDHFPMLRLLEIADQLVASAKQKSRSDFAVDWLVCTQASLTDLRTLRRRDYLVRIRHGLRCVTRLLTQRPQWVLSAPTSQTSELTLQALLIQTAEVCSIARNKRRDIQVQLHQNAHVDIQLRRKHIGKLEGEIAIWHELAHDVESTPWVDLVECSEIRFLGETA